MGGMEIIEGLVVLWSAWNDMVETKNVVRMDFRMDYQRFG